jgi:hypothetical protein
VTWPGLTGGPNLCFVFSADFVRSHEKIFMFVKFCSPAVLWKFFPEHLDRNSLKRL